MEFTNIQAGTVTVADGDTSASVTFDKTMRNVPSVVVTPQSAESGVYVTSKSETGFTVDGLSSSGSNDVEWIAFDYQTEV